MEEFKVVGPFEIAGKKRGETVRLDPQETNIQVLIDCGHIERIKAAPVKAKDKE
jgi:hypothetical protein